MVRHKVKRIAALTLAVVTLGLNITQVSMAAGSDYYRSTLGTNKSLGSPLSNSDFSSDDWDKWEMAIFGMFLGNYVKLGQEDYGDAFKSGSDGINALQFAAGGDANSNGVLRKMLTEAITGQKNEIALYTRYKYVSFGKESTVDLETRPSKFNDLFPEIRRYTGDSDDIKIAKSAIVDHPRLWMTINKDSIVKYPKYTSQSASGNELGGGTGLNDTTGLTVVAAALLPEFTVKLQSGESKTILDFTDGYDVQITQAAVAKMVDNLKNEGIEKLMDENPDIVLDGFGNICAKSSGKLKVLIPGAANKNLNRNKEVNILNSLIVNGLMAGSSEANMAAQGAAGYLQDEDTKIAGFPSPTKRILSVNGLNAVGLVEGTGKSSLQSGKIIIYNDTDPLLYTDVYSKLRQNLDVDAKLQELENSGKFNIRNQASTATNNANSSNASGSGTSTGTGGTTGTTGTTTSENTLVKGVVYNTAAPSSGSDHADPGLPYVDVETDSSSEWESVSVSGSSSFGTILGSASGFKYGSYINDVIDKNSLYRAPFKIEMINTPMACIDFSWTGDIKSYSRVPVAQVSYSAIGDMYTYTLNEDSLVTMLLVQGSSTSGTDKVDLLGDHYYLTPSLSAYANKTDPAWTRPSTWFESTSNYRFVKDYASYALRCLDGSITGAMTEQSSMRSTLAGLTDPFEIFALLSSENTSDYTTTSGNIQSAKDSDNGKGSVAVGSLLKKFTAERYNLTDAKYKDMMSNDKTLKDIASKRTKDPTGTAVSLYGKTEAGGDTRAAAIALRVCKVYKPSAVFAAVSKIFDLDSSALFKQYTTNMYITYLDWYGILDNKKESELRLDTEIFQGNKYLDIDADALIDAMTDEEKQKTIMNNTFKLLDTSDAGREYRKTLIGDLCEDLLDRFYESASNEDGSGFLNVTAYKDLPFISSIFENWDLINAVLCGILFILIIIVGLLNRQTLTWLIFVEIASFLSVVAVPAYTEITPYLCNQAIQKSFEKNAFYWLACEQVNTAGQYDSLNQGSVNDSDLTSAMSDLDVRRTTVLLNSIRAQQSDKTILVKQDISKKVIDQLSIGWDKLQSKASTRWLVPSLIQQISGDADTYDYVYVTAYDWFNNMSRAYIAALAPKDTSGTVDPRLASLEAGGLNECFGSGELQYKSSGGSSVGEDRGDFTASHKQSAWFGMYKSTNDPGLSADASYRSVTRLGEDSEDDVHTYMYMLRNGGLKINDLQGLGDATEGMQKADWDKLADTPSSGVVAGFATDILTYNEELLSYLNSYNRYDEVSGLLDYKLSNLWCTESVAPYFYSVVHDTATYLGATDVQGLANQLLGSTIQEVDSSGNPTGNKWRTSFMHKGETGYVRDFLDLEELFTNVVPYMYAEQLIAGGNGKEGNAYSGLIPNTEMGDSYEIYSKNENSWLYRCNWATKLLTDRKFRGSATIKYVDGGTKKSATVKTMIDPRCYTVRPMVFSEAQMKDLGLEESDLSLVEVKCVNLNKSVCDEWTQLINFANLDGMNSEIMMRLMAAKATTEFDKKMTTTNLLGSTLSLYPRNLDLRNITWDAILRHMLVTATHNTNYISTTKLMRNIINSVGIFPAFIVCLITLVNTVIVPVGREAILALLFLLTIASLLLNLFSSAKDKLKVNSAWAMTYILFGVFTSIFYYLIALVVGSGNMNEVLSTGMSLNVLKTSSLLYRVLIVLLLDGLYVFGVYKFIREVVFKNGIRGVLDYVKTGGFATFYNVASQAAGFVHGAIDKVNGTVSRASSMAGSFTGSLVSKDSKIMGKVEVTNAKENGRTVPIKTDNSAKMRTGSVEGFGDSTVSDSSYVLDDIERQSKKGSKTNKANIEKTIAKGKEQTSVAKEQKEEKKK